MMRPILLSLLWIAASALAAPLPNHVLARKIRENPRGDEAKLAVRELDRRGAPGWRTLGTLIRDVARNDSGAARGLVSILAKGDEPERLVALRSAWRETLPAELRGDLAVALARGYPDSDTLLLRSLFDERLPRRDELLRALAVRALDSAEIKKALDDPHLAMDAYSILLGRGVVLPVSDLRGLAKASLAIAPSRTALSKFCAALADGHRWPVVEAIALLTDDKDEALARAAHVFLLRISGKDMARDADIWRSWIAARRTQYKPPEDSSPGRVAAAVLLGSDFLRRDLLDDGQSVMRGRNGQGNSNEVGATALSVLALWASGVRADDPAIVKAIETTLLPRGPGGVPTLPSEARTHNYTCSLVLMALAKLDARAYRDKIQHLASLIISSQLPNGQWTYRVGTSTSARREPRRRTTGDNSNSQYALLALRAARRAGADIPSETWMRALSFWHMTLTDYGWSYGFLHRRGNRSMTAAGLSSVSICLEGLYSNAGERIATHRPLARGLQALGRDLIRSGYRNVDLYAYYGIERACILTGTKRFNDFDWYAVGAGNLVRGQASDGSWWGDAKGGRLGKGWKYGPAIESAYALLFLKRATTRVDGGRDRGQVEVEGVRPARRNRASRMVH